MTNKKKQLINYLLIFIMIIAPFTISIVKADSGWDSSYDSGSSWSSSSSSHDYSSHDYSSYDYGSHSSSGSYSSGSYSDGSGAFEIMVLIYVIIIIIIICNSKPSDKEMAEKALRDDNLLKKASDITAQLEAKYSTDNKIKLSKEEQDKIIDDLFNNYVEVQDAWMNFDYDSLKKLCTDELYNSYMSQLKILKSSNNQNIMNDYKLLDSKIISYVDLNGTHLVRVYMKISLFDYVINMGSKNVIRGTKSYPLTNNYYMEFIKKSNTTYDKCPCCGAELKELVHGRCSYCRSIITDTSGEFVLSKKTNMR